MKIKLNVLERVLLLNMLPQRGNLANIRAISNTAKIIMITPEEEKEFDIQKGPQMTTWNESGKEEKEFEIPASSIKTIRLILHKLDTEEALPVNAGSLVEKFLPGEGEDEE
jgi:adenylate cyclase class IV